MALLSPRYRLKPYYWSTIAAVKVWGQSLDCAVKTYLCDFLFTVFFCVPFLKCHGGTSADRILARMIFLGLRIFSLIMLRNFPKIFEVSAASYRGAKCPTLKTAEKGAEWVKVKQPKNSWKNSRNTRKNNQNSCFSGVSAVFPAVFRLFYRVCFSAVFNVGHLAPL